MICQPSLRIGRARANGNDVAICGDRDARLCDEGNHLGLNDRYGGVEARRRDHIARGSLRISDQARHQQQQTDHTRDDRSCPQTHRNLHMYASTLGDNGVTPRDAALSHLRRRITLGGGPRGDSDRARGDQHA